VRVIGKEPLDRWGRDEFSLNRFEVVFNPSSNKDKAVVIDPDFVTGVQPSVLPKLSSFVRDGCSSPAYNPLL
jgi:hypothetical protein